VKRYRSLFRLAISAVAWLNKLRGMFDQREAPALLWQLVGVGLDDDFDSFVAGVNFDPHGAVPKSTSCLRPDLPRIMASPARARLERA
jgi:hypothetical protein